MMEKDRTASGVKVWNVEAATSVEQLMDVLFVAASGLKTQALESPVLESSTELKARIDSLADELHGLQLDVSTKRN